MASLGMDKDVEIVEFGAGGGILGEALTEQGFTNIVGLDGSAGMLAVAEATGYFKEAHQVVFGCGAFPEHLKRRFPVAVSIGTLGRNHAPPDTFDDMVASLRGAKGDTLLLTMREDCYKECGFKEHLDGLIEQGTLQLVHEETFEREVHNHLFEGNKLWEKPVLGVLLHLELKLDLTST